LENLKGRSLLGYLDIDERYNTRIYLLCEGVDWSKVALDRVLQQSSANVMMNFQVL
jgi:hypothetical protein